MLFLYQTATCGPREAKFGTVKLRLRMELEDERTLLISNFQLPQSVYVNVHAKKDYEVIKETVEGEVDTRKYSLVSRFRSKCETCLQSSTNSLP